ncbi:hypothetical protein HETIRDRAFT_102733 [Heterobasidion irregulare TC 32-1]|uniref:Uncharacterized protein n=1 Tax=Heterobasidion irregulare (strain TC 32-1) TaxID=747525 RepID=W4KFL7_HETIT|nr:uncharacterized protein HETIRDRAFT_102733 [Heterobasidion irregulare TC 32-1]ETW84110.1 hypothetical protein HETIRDRAFT_102733 [Heterobasidion irregulare TC 32-1]
MPHAPRCAPRPTPEAYTLGANFKYATTLYAAHPPTPRRKEARKTARATMVPVATTSSPQLRSPSMHPSRRTPPHSIHISRICILHASRAKHRRSPDWARSRPPRTSSSIADGPGRVQTPSAGRTTAMHETLSGSRVLERSLDTGRQPDGGTGAPPSGRNTSETRFHGRLAPNLSGPLPADTPIASTAYTQTPALGERPAS